MPFTLHSRLPAAAQGLSMLVTTTELTAEESWKPDQADVRVGDAITRTITLRAADIMGMGLPPLRFDTPDGVAVYPKAPSVKDEIYRGDVAGTRVETSVYVLEQEGTFKLPALTIPWFNPETRTLQQVDLPSRELTVAANPAFAMGVTPPEAVGEDGPIKIDVEWNSGWKCGRWLVSRLQIEVPDERFKGIRHPIYWFEGRIASV
jgi:hypothetical protein